MVFGLKERKNQTKYSSKKDAFAPRFILVIIGFFLFTIAIFLQMFRWQVLSSERLTEIADQIHTEQTKTFQTRGTIYAADGSVLAFDEAAYDLIVSVSTDADDIAKFEVKKEELINDISKILEVEEALIREKFDSKKTYAYIPLVDGISVEEKRILESRKYYGLIFEPSSVRKYPNASLASHVLGFVGRDQNDVKAGACGGDG